ncbi:MAG: capsular biosynthesis protein [Lachnospiraceae bacterium]|nr:capsular biosynthesis protein [Lachnospiraceae bacterium]
MCEDYSFVFDIDGTLCPLKRQGESYADLVPFKEMVDRLRYYHENGAKIILFTSRNMNTYKGDLNLIHEYTAPVLRDWLKKWDIPYDELIFGKPWPGHKGFYVDDRTVRPDEFLNKSIEELEDICHSSRAIESTNQA